MILREVFSDQLYNWSEKNEETFQPRTTKTPQGVASKTAAPRPNPPRLTHRTLQTLRKTWLQVRRRTRPWTQVLSLGDANSRQTSDGLRPLGLPRRGGHLAGQLPVSSRDSRGTLQNQPRAATQKRETVGRQHGCIRDSLFGSDRYEGGGDPRRQHASIALGSELLSFGGSA